MVRIFISACADFSIENLEIGENLVKLGGLITFNTSRGLVCEHLQEPYLFEFLLPVVEQVVEVAGDDNSGKWVTREDRMNQGDHLPSPVLINLIRYRLNVYAQHVQRHALVRDAPPAEGCTKGLDHLHLFVIRNDQSTAISF